MHANTIEYSKCIWCCRRQTSCTGCPFTLKLSVKLHYSVVRFSSSGISYPHNSSFPDNYRSFFIFKKPLKKLSDFLIFYINFDPLCTLPIQYGHPVPRCLICIEHCQWCPLSHTHHTFLFENGMTSSGFSPPLR